MTNAVEQLVQTAGALAKAGRWEEAEAAWRDLHRLDPANPKALFGLGFHALQRGDAEAATTYLTAACEAAPNDFMALQALANARRQAGDPAGEIGVLERILATDAYFLPALLAKADFVERHGSRVAAATMYANALKVAPPEPHWPEMFRVQLEHARAIVERNAAAYGAYLSERLAPLHATLTAAQSQRWRESASVMAGLTPAYRSECNQLYAPRLPALPFFDAADFPWAKALEEKTDVIRDELLNMLRTGQDRFSPYIAYRPGDPVNQWRELNHSMRWSTLWLWRSGTPVGENLERCPETAKALAAVEMADIGGLCPNAMFSALAPRTRIPPHNGETNTRLVVHLPLVVPDNCSYRVGFDWTKWEVGKLLIFDDTIEHEARNDSDELRVVLIFDIWNPLLSRAEREVVRAMAAAAREFAAQG